MELRPGHNTGHDQQDARSSAVGASESPATHVTKFAFSHRVPQALEAPGAGILPPTGAQSAGADGGAGFAEHHQKLLGLYFCLLFETYMRPLDGLALRGFQLVPPIKGIPGAAGWWARLIRTGRAGAAWQNRRVRHQRLAGSSCFPFCGCPNTHETDDSSSFPSRTRKRQSGKRVEAAMLSTTEDHIMCPPTWRRERGPCCQRRSLEEVQKRGGGRSSTVGDATKSMLAGLCFVQDPTRISPARSSPRTRPGMTLEKALKLALTGPTLSLERVLFAFSTQPVLFVQF